MKHKVKITFHGEREHGTISVPGIIEHNYGKDHNMYVDVRMSDDALTNLALALSYWHMHTTVGGWGYSDPTVMDGRTERTVHDFISPRNPGGVSAQPAILIDYLTKNARAFTFAYNDEMEVR